MSDPNSQKINPADREITVEMEITPSDEFQKWLAAKRFEAFFDSDVE